MRVHKKEAVDPNVELKRLHMVDVEFFVCGRTSLVYNRMPMSAMRALLCPPLPKNKAERAATLRHRPIEEYRDSVYRTRRNDGPTRLMLPAVCFKRAMSSVALDIPGLAKTEVGRLLWTEPSMLDLYGVPQLFMTPVRCAGASKAPDIRTRAIVPEWACRFRARFVVGRLQGPTVVNLAKAAGTIRGVGDGRPEKGWGSYGQFDLVAPDNPTFLARCKLGRVQQDQALDTPLPYDDDTADLLQWYTEEVLRRRGAGAKAPVAEMAEGVMQ